MDFGTTLKHIAPFLIPILALSIPIVAIIWSNRTRMHNATLLHETLRHLSELGRPIPESLLDELNQLHATNSARNWTPRSSLRAGVISLLFLVMQPNDWFWAIGMIPLFIGIGLLVISRSDSKLGLNAVPPYP
jgi:hypothetical protein